MKRYNAYKDSGIEWIGEIPEKWEVKKLKHLTKLQGGYAFKSDLFSTEGPPVIRIGDISNNINFDECKKIDDDTIPKEYCLDQFDTLIALSGATTGKTCFVNNIPPKAYINQRVARIMFSNKLLFYIVNSGFFQEQILLTASGSAQENISNSQIENLEISISNNPEEQTAIANYLDRQTAVIDELIADKKRLLQLYEEEKTAIINQAVTKGINPDAPMKDSGIECLPAGQAGFGVIPEHWEVKRLKYVATLKSGNNIVSEQIKDSDKYPVFGGNGLRGYFCEYTHDGNFILIGRQGAYCGNIKYGAGKFWASEHAVVLAPISNYEFKYLGELLRSMNLGQYSVSAAQPGIAVEVVKNLQIPFPPIQEQKELVSFINTECTRINAKTEKTKKLIDLLTEYRTALISEVVTGKIKVA